MRIGILGAASIARDRFLPSLSKQDLVKCVAIAARNPEGERIKEISERYNIDIYKSYDAIIEDQTIDSVYIPLPPALHFEWAKKALNAGKNVFLEKPATITYKQIEKLVSLAKRNNLALYENYMFLRHAQLEEMKEYIAKDNIGDIRLYRATFTFPKRSSNDFRYDKELGGGALLDAGGYVVRLARDLLGDDVELSYAKMNYVEEEEVDMFGSFTAVNKEGLAVQGSYGMDNNYQCSLEAFGQKAKLVNDRIFTAGSDFEPEMKKYSNNPVETIKLSKDDHFKKSILYFYNLCNDVEKREKEYASLLKQGELIKIIKEF